ncbi:hypothetical protein BH23VER1_BH23VER1_14270 [soil metagenome]
MRGILVFVVTALWASGLIPASLAQDQPAEADIPTSRADLAERVKRSLVSVSHYGRDGKVAASGSGFVVSEDGLVATCLHVIGEARRVRVELADGRAFEVESIHASDRKLDLAVLKIPADGLVPLAIADSDAARPGEPIIVMGNPHGLEFSVVGGVLSGVRDIESVPMLQVALPVEQGNSGGPVLNTSGEVLGIVTIKSLIADNLGFAMPSSALALLLQDPNPVGMDRWLTIGALDPTRWLTSMGGRWSQRAGRIAVDSEPGDGFGGRSLCLSTAAPQAPPEPYEIAVSVRLGDESGAAGLVFAAGAQEDAHYGFYPTGGNFRLTRFEGPTAFTWTILEQMAAPASYRPGEFNRLRVRVEPDRILAFVNGEQILESTDAVLRGGGVGLAKFRSTAAEFMHFRVGSDLAEATPDPEALAAITEMIDALPVSSVPAPADPGLVTALAGEPALSRRLLADRARLLESAAAQIRELAADVLVQEVIAELHEALPGDLARAALAIARLDNPELDAQPYLDELDQMAATVQRQAGDDDPIAALNKFIFEDHGFHGSRSDYYNRSNSYLNEVIDDREGIPITLAILYLEVARRAGIDDLHGLGLPGHFIVVSNPASDSPRYIDVFDRAAPLSDKEADAIVSNYTIDYAARPAASFPPAAPEEIVARLLENLKNIAVEEEEWLRARRYADVMVSLDPDSPHARLSRAILNVQAGQAERAASDFRWILDARPKGIDLSRIRQFLGE